MSYVSHVKRLFKLSRDAAVCCGVCTHTLLFFVLRVCTHLLVCVCDAWAGRRQSSVQMLQLVALLNPDVNIKVTVMMMMMMVMMMMMMMMVMM